MQKKRTQTRTNFILAFKIAVRTSCSLLVFFLALLAKISTQANVLYVRPSETIEKVDIYIAVLLIGLDDNIFIMTGQCKLEGLNGKPTLLQGSIILILKKRSRLNLEIYIASQLF